MKSNLNLLELQQLIKQTLNNSLESNYWLTAEINDIKINGSGHCYLELVQKDPTSKFIQARMNATIWSYTYGILSSFFRSTLNRDLQAGMKILVKINIQYHEVYGISLNITDIDPSYTMGDLELERRKVIARLKIEGLFTKNKELELPILPQRLAVISSENAAGYQDFINHLNSASGFNFKVTLFPAVMQGNSAALSIANSLKEIAKQRECFDLVILIRGGGSQSDLSCFDVYDLAKAVALCPLPVVTGIGHDKDVSITDMVVSKSLKTPTAVANYLMDLMNKQADLLNNFTNNLIYYSSNYLLHQKQQLENIHTTINSIAKITLTKELAKLNKWLPQRLEQASRQLLKSKRYELDVREVKLMANDPMNILKKGYSITLRDGKAIPDTRQLKEGDIIETLFEKNSVQSKIIKTNNNE